MYKDIAIKIAWAFLGKPYIWGGDDSIKGFDCSGFMIEILKSVGILPRDGDWTAQGLYDRFQHTEVSFGQEGCLVFWGSSKRRITHVEMCISEDLSIGASGGGSKTKTEQDAVRHNAYIKVRPFRSRTGIVAYVDPFSKG